MLLATWKNPGGTPLDNLKVDSGQTLTNMAGVTTAATQGRHVHLTYPWGCGYVANAGLTDLDCTFKVNWTQSAKGGVTWVVGPLRGSLRRRTR